MLAEVAGSRGVPSPVTAVAVRIDVEWLRLIDATTDRRLIVALGEFEASSARQSALGHSPEEVSYSESAFLSYARASSIMVLRNG